MKDETGFSYAALVGPKSVSCTKLELRLRVGDLQKINQRDKWISILSQKKKKKKAWIRLDH